jgi:hypothetical protein
MQNKDCFFVHVVSLLTKLRNNFVRIDSNLRFRPESVLLLFKAFFLNDNYDSDKIHSSDRELEF